MPRFFHFFAAPRAHFRKRYVRNARAGHRQGQFGECVQSVRSVRYVWYVQAQLRDKFVEEPKVEVSADEFMAQQAALMSGNVADAAALPEGPPDPVDVDDLHKRGEKQWGDLMVDNRKKEPLLGGGTIGTGGDRSVYDPTLERPSKKKKSAPVPPPGRPPAQDQSRRPPRDNRRDSGQDRRRDREDRREPARDSRRDRDRRRSRSGDRRRRRSRSRSRDRDRRRSRSRSRDRRRSRSRERRRSKSRSRDKKHSSSKSHGEAKGDAVHEMPPDMPDFTAAQATARRGLQSLRMCFVFCVRVLPAL